MKKQELEIKTQDITPNKSLLFEPPLTRRQRRALARKSKSQPNK